MKRLYYFVPICPNCASRRTGRYVMPPMRKKETMMIDSLRHGEIIKFRNPEPVKNAFCMECGHEFIGDIRIRFIDEGEMEEEIEARGTEYILEEYIQKHHIDPNKKASSGFFSGLFSSFDL